jgi:hypothetical protein
VAWLNRDVLTDSPSQAARHGELSLALVEGTRLSVITIGIDPHKSLLTAVALDQTGRLLATRRITVNAAAYKTLWSVPDLEDTRLHSL